MTTDEMSIAQIKNLLAKKSEQLSELRAERKQLKSRLKEVDKQINRITGSRKGRRKRRTRKPASPATKPAKRKPTDGPSLGQVVQDILAKAGRPMKVAEVTEAVKKTGYTSSSKQFGRLVSAALRETKQVRRVSRGKYTLKK